MERQLVDRAVVGDQGALTALLGLYGDQARKRAHVMLAEIFGTVSKFLGGPR